MKLLPRCADEGEEVLFSDVRPRGGCREGRGMGSVDAWVTLLTSRAAAEGERVAYRFLRDGDVAAAETTLTYRQLDVRARAIAATVRARGGSLAAPNILILCPPGLDFVAAFFGVIYSGAVAVPAHPPATSRRRGRNERLDGIVRDCRPAVALTTAALRETVEDALREIAPQ